LERELRGIGANVATVLSGASEASGHLEVAQAVAMGAADSGIATRDAAIAYGLPFLPLAEERYDLVLRGESESDPRVQRFLNNLTTSSFRRELSALGYDVSNAGERVAQLKAA
jgi:molybdate-binding protein